MSAAPLPSQPALPTAPGSTGAATHPVTVVAITGVGRSGTTLLERMLGAVPGFVALGEVLHLPERGLLADERCGCGARFADCAFWQEVGDRAFGGWDRLDPQALHGLARAVDRHRRILRLMGPAGRSGRSGRRLADYQHHLRAVYTAAAAVAAPVPGPDRGSAPAPVVIDSSKHPSHAYVLRRAAGIDLRVVLVVRDPRGVAASWQRRVARPEAEGAGAPDAARPFMAQSEPWRIGARWLAWNALAEALDPLGTPVLRVRYEDMVADPVATVRAVGRFAGRPVGPADTGFLSPGPDGTWVARLGPVHSVAGNPMRFRHGDIPIAPDERWRAREHAPGTRAVSLLTAPLRAGYGYWER